MHRRGFLGSLIALVVAPFAPTPPPEIDWKTIPSTIEIDHASYEFWQKKLVQSHPLPDMTRAFRDIFDRCQ